MIGIVLLLLVVPVGAFALAYGHFGMAGGLAVALGALVVTAAVFVMPFAGLVRAHEKEAKAEGPLEWTDEKPES